MRDADRYFLLKGVAGLGNRLSTLTSVIAYCLKTDRTILVDWTDGMFGPKGHNRFFDYFMLKDVKHLATKYDLEDLRSGTLYPEFLRRHLSEPFFELYDGTRVYPPWKRRLIRALTLNRWRVSMFWVLRSQYEKEFEGSCVPSLLRNIWSGKSVPVSTEYPEWLEERVLVGADYLPPFDLQGFRRHIQWAPDALGPLKKIRSDLGIGKETLGIHVRQTDWIWFKSLDPLLERLKAFTKNSKVPIFLATDSAPALEQIRKLVPSVITYSKHLPEPEEDGLHHMGYRQGDAALASKMYDESIIDLFLLSSCGTFWFQGGSSFSMIAHAFSQGEQRAEDWTKF